MLEKLFRHVSTIQPLVLLHLKQGSVKTNGRVGPRVAKQTTFPTYLRNDLQPALVQNVCLMILVAGYSNTFSPVSFRDDVAMAQFSMLEFLVDISDLKGKRSPVFNVWFRFSFFLELLQNRRRNETHELSIIVSQKTQTNYFAI